MIDMERLCMQKIRLKVSRLYPLNEGSLAGCEPPVRIDPRIHRLQGWTADFPSQVHCRLLECPELEGTP